MDENYVRHSKASRHRGNSQLYTGTGTGTSYCQPNQVKYVSGYTQRSPNRHTRSSVRHNSNSSLDADAEHSDAEQPNVTCPEIKKHRFNGSLSSIDNISQNSNEDSGFFTLNQPKSRSKTLEVIAPIGRDSQEAINSNHYPTFRSFGSTDTDRSGEYSQARVNEKFAPNACNDMDTSPTSLSQDSGAEVKPRPRALKKNGFWRKLKSGNKNVSSKNPELSNSCSRLNMVSKSTIGLNSSATDQPRMIYFSHYDCQSASIDLAEFSKIVRRSPEQRRNTCTGASAASLVPSESLGLASTSSNNIPAAYSEQLGDPGDGKSNNLILSCSYFRNELGGEVIQSVSVSGMALRSGGLSPHRLYGHFPEKPFRSPECNAVAILDSSTCLTASTDSSIVEIHGHAMEYVDHGATYYRNFFLNFEHQNYFGVDDTIGPVAISIRRERVQSGTSGAPFRHQYRFILRTLELGVLRGSVDEDVIPTTNRISSNKGLPLRDIADYLVPDLKLTCLRLGKTGTETTDKLLSVDEQRLTKTFRVGVMYCADGQSTEEEMYNNEHACPIFEAFLSMLGETVRLKGFEGFKGGLDTKSDSTGTHSVYSKLGDCEIMFHVSTMLPFTASNSQQLLRKRHIGNNIVTIVFQTPGALAFTPRSVRSNFQHVFIVVRAHESVNGQFKYSVAVSRSRDVPPFGPIIPPGATFTNKEEFIHFLHAKVINAKNAVLCSEKFQAMLRRSRAEYLRDLSANHVTNHYANESYSRFGKFNLGSGRKREKARTDCILPEVSSTGALTWPVLVEDYSQVRQVSCILAISPSWFVLIDESSHGDVIAAIPCDRIIAWHPAVNRIKVYYGKGECIDLYTKPATEHLSSILVRLTNVTSGCQCKEMILSRGPNGDLGFHIYHDGIVIHVDPTGMAASSGLKKYSRLVEVCESVMVTLRNEQLIELLRTSSLVKVLVVEPFDDGNVRGPFEKDKCEELEQRRLVQQQQHQQQQQQNTQNVANTSPSRSPDLRPAPLNLRPNAIAIRANKNRHSATYRDISQLSFDMDSTGSPTGTRYSKGRLGSGTGAITFGSQMELSRFVAHNFDTPHGGISAPNRASATVAARPGRVIPSIYSVFDEINNGDIRRPRARSRGRLRRRERDLGQSWLAQSTPSVNESADNTRPPQLRNRFGTSNQERASCVSPNGSKPSYRIGQSCIAQPYRTRLISASAAGGRQLRSTPEMELADALLSPRQGHVVPQAFLSFDSVNPEFSAPDTGHSSTTQARTPDFSDSNIIPNTPHIQEPIQENCEPATSIIPATDYNRSSAAPKSDMIVRRRLAVPIIPEKEQNNLNNNNQDSQFRSAKDPHAYLRYSPERSASQPVRRAPSPTKRISHRHSEPLDGVHASASMPGNHAGTFQSGRPVNKPASGLTVPASNPSSARAVSNADVPNFLIHSPQQAAKRQTSPPKETQQQGGLYVATPVQPSTNPTTPTNRSTSVVEQSSIVDSHISSQPQAYPLPLRPRQRLSDSSADRQWNALVEEASRRMEPDNTATVSEAKVSPLHSSQTTAPNQFNFTERNQYKNSQPPQHVMDSSLQEECRRLNLLLLKERQDKEQLSDKVKRLQEDNARLQQESITAERQLKHVADRMRMSIAMQRENYVQK